jgi:hypothetical protein
MNHLSDELLNEYLDKALEAHSRTRADLHLSSCADCAERLAALRALFAEIESLPEAALSRDLAGPVIQRLSSRNVLPSWLRLTVGLQTAAALIALLVAAPFVIEFASTWLPTLQPPSLGEVFIPFQSQWTSWLDILSQFQLPSPPELPMFDVSSLVVTLTLAGVSTLWLVGNGLLLRNQIK